MREMSLRAKRSNLKARLTKYANARRTRDREIVIARRIAPKQSRDVGDCLASLAMTTESWSLADLGSHVSK